MRAFLLAAVVLAAPLAHAQGAPDAAKARPYARLTAGGGVVSNQVDYGTFRVEQNGAAVAGSVEAGVRRRSWSVGVELAALRAGSEAQRLPLLAVRSARSVSSQASASVVTRSRFSLGPVHVRVGSGIGVSRTVAHVREATQIAVGGGIPTGAPSGGDRTTRRARPLFSTDASIGREVGRTFVGVGFTAGTDYDARVSDGAVRYGLVLEQGF